MTDAVWCADVRFLGDPGLIAAGVLEGPGGLAVVDPGPTTALSGLGQALAARGHSLADLRAVLVTHIHLDHSGAAGTLVRQVPALRVFVHARGAPHVVDPTRLVGSARRLYGDEMDRLWGDVPAVPRDRVVALEGGETIDVVGRPVQVAYTPGHAVHHVCYFDEGSGVAFTGDVGGMALAGTACALPPTPPPDIDVEAWQESLGRIRRWRPRRLFLAHFGLVDAPARHLDDLEARLLDYARIARETLLDDALSDDQRIARFHQAVLDDLRRCVPAELVPAVEHAYYIDDSWLGLARYWRKRWEVERDSGAR